MAHGSQQSFHFEVELYAPVALVELTGTTISVAITRNCSVSQMDVEGAFLNGLPEKLNIRTMLEMSAKGIIPMDKSFD